MELQTGWPLLIQQFKSLMYKNILLSWRNKLASFLRLFSSLFFMLLLFCIQKAIDSSYSSSTAYKTVLNPSPIVSFPIPQCEDGFLIRVPCFDFVWSGNQSSTITEIVNRIMINNPGRPVPSYKVKSFTTPNEVDEWLLNNQMRCPGALHFSERNASVISYGIQTNSTQTPERGHYEDPTFKFQIPLQMAAEREIARSLIGDSKFNWEVSLKEFARPAPEMLDAMYTVGPTCFLAIAMFGFVFQLNALVAEKELKLRQAMSMMGLYDSVYWSSWFIWEGFVTLISVFFTILSGMMFQFNFFLHNNFVLVFLLFFLFQFNMLVLAFMISAFVKKSSSSTSVGFSVFIIAFLAQLITEFGFPYMKRFSKKYRIVWSFFPPNLFAQGLQLLAGATLTREDPGISWSKRTVCATNDTECVTTINGMCLWLVLTYFLCFLFAIYFDNVIPDSSGLRKSLIYFLKPGYWMNKGDNKVQEGSACSCKTSAPLLDTIVPDDEDVLEEENLVKKQTEASLADDNVAVQLRGLVKTYPGTTNINCCRCVKTKPYHAIQGLWINFAKDQLFCLLGPNGAGKTTTINCLTGLTPVTSGDAHIYGYSIRSPTDMANIRRIIGVCPQFDILWDALSGEEHLYLFCSLKGLPYDSVKSVVDKALAEVKLTESAKMRAGGYSGGMKRRLSVAIALIGDPKLVILDEPTTGMDPITRRHVWDIIENAKKGRAIILTTHSMEEADILSDRIGIMAKGRLRCIGTSIRLKSRFGTGFVANVRFSDGNRTGEDNISSTQQEAVKQFFEQHLGILPKEENKSYLTFVIPHEKERLLTNFFVELQNREEEFGIVDVQLGLTTLEEVFLNIAKEAELESAAADGRFATLEYTSGRFLQIPVGARFVGIPGTESEENPQGVMIEVSWEQDDSGALCISHYSKEMPVPSSSHAEQIPSRNVSDKSESIKGFVIDPTHLNQRK